MKNVSAGKFLWASPLLFVLIVANAKAHVLSVPETYATISEAISASVAEDTILVNRGIYPEQLWFPAHRIYVMSHYELTGDTLDVSQTVIEGYSYAEEDTATIALFLPGSANGSKLCGFTLQGGHGMLTSFGGRWSATFYADSSSPVICHNVITGNTCDHTPIGNFVFCSGEFRGNHIFDNTFTQTGLRILNDLYTAPVIVEGNVFGANPSSEAALYPGILLEPNTSAVIRNNLFRGIVGQSDVAVTTHGSREVLIENNVFDSLTVTGYLSPIVWLYATTEDVVIRDNVFSNLQIADGAALMVMSGQNWYDVLLEGNVFENNSAPGPYSNAGVWLDGYNGVIRNNIFRSNRASISAAIQLISGGSPAAPTGMTMEYNLIEACSTFSLFPQTAPITRSYDGPFIARNNIFRQNYPMVIGKDGVHYSRIADFMHNYWGDASGPYHPLLNPDGLGDTVGDSVLFEPWLTDSVISSAPENPVPLPEKFSLESYPNPFNPETKLVLTVPEPGRYRLTLYDLLGREIREVWEGAVVIHRVVPLFAGDLPSGVYFARATASLTHHSVATAKLVLVK
jgi:hypothetical protein